MRTRQQSSYAYRGLSCSEFAERTGMSVGQVRDLIKGGWFDKAADPPECLDIRSPGAKQATYRIHPSALDRFKRERAA